MQNRDSLSPIDAQTLAGAVVAGDRAALARAITLVESTARQHQAAAQALLTRLLPQSGASIRIGVTGVPGAGKSTFIDALGSSLTGLGHKVAVLAVDPSSSRSGGSILGDKTRMERLSRDERAFIRPTPTGGLLGGVAGGTREAIIVCEAAGYDVILVETVGAGQSEVALRSVVDFMLLLLITGAGDDLQGIKKGVMEMADALVINKADGDNLAAARAARAQFNQSLQFVAPATAGWRTRAYTASALTGAGISEIWAVISEFAAATKTSGAFAARRRRQRVAWLHSALEAALRQYLRDHPALQAALPVMEAAVMNDELPASAAADRLLQRVLPDQ